MATCFYTTRSVLAHYNPNAGNSTVYPSTLRLRQNARQQPQQPRQRQFSEHFLVAARASSSPPSAAVGDSQRQRQQNQQQQRLDASTGSMQFSEEYLSDDDVSFVAERLGDVPPSSSWLDFNYVQLSVTSYRLVQEQAQNALRKHFEHHRMQQQQQQRQREGYRGRSEAAAVEGGQQHHQCCAETRDHTFCCGDDLAVASSVAPASVASGLDHFIGTPPPAASA